MRLQRQKRKWHSREIVAWEIKKEYAMFKFKMLSGTVHEVYGSCRRICFYESLWEYFLYSEHISRMFLEAALGKGGNRMNSLQDRIYREIIYYEDDVVQMENELAGKIDELLAPYSGKVGGEQMRQLGEKWGRQDRERLSRAGAVTNQVSEQGMKLVFGSETELYGCAKVTANVLGLRSPAAEAVLAKCFQEKSGIWETGVSMRNLVDCLSDKDIMGAGEQEWAAKIDMRLRGWNSIPDIRFCVRKNRKQVRKSAIWDFSGLDSAYVDPAAYLLIYCLYCQRKWDFRKGIKANKTFVIIDEFQNLDCERKGVVGTCLTEGQKYKLFLVLITQFLAGNFSDAVLNQLKQGGFRFHFRLSEEEAAAISRQLSCNSQTQTELYRKL